MPGLQASRTVRNSANRTVDSLITNNGVKDSTIEGPIDRTTYGSMDINVNSSVIVGKTVDKFIANHSVDRTIDSSMGGTIVSSMGRTIVSSTDIIICSSISSYKLNIYSHKVTSMAQLILMQ